MGSQPAFLRVHFGVMSTTQRIRTVSWKPQTTVPMFKLLDAVNVDARVPGGGGDLISDDVVTNLTAEIVPLVPDDAAFHLDALSPLSGADFGADFDDLFKDFANDDMFKDLF